jgi:hypothetical protein
MNGVSRGDVLALAPVGIAHHAAWLRRCGATIAVADQIEIDVVEDVRAQDEDAVEGEFCFTDDLRPVTRADIEEGVRVMAWARGDLLSVITGLPDAILDWRPPLSAMARVDEWKPEPRTIGEILRDTAASEFYYRTGLRDGAIEDEQAEELRDLALQRERLEDALGRLPAEDRGRRFEPVRSWQASPEHWTARKVIRRVISHERFHTAEIRQRLAWLLVGVPDFAGNRNRSSS